MPNRNHLLFIIVSATICDHVDIIAMPCRMNVMFSAYLNSKDKNLYILQVITSFCGSFLPCIFSVCTILSIGITELLKEIVKSFSISQVSVLHFYSFMVATYIIYRSRKRPFFVLNCIVILFKK